MSQEVVEVEVKVTVKRSAYVDKDGNIKKIESYSVAIPKPIAKELGITGGERLKARVIIYNINGRSIKGVFYYKP